MEENNQNNVNAEELKKEAKETVNQVKDSFKHVNMKNDTENAKNFFSRFIKEPVKMLGEMARDNSNTFLKTAIILLVIWVLASVVGEVIGIVSSIFRYGLSYFFSSFFKTIFGSILDVVKSLVAPILTIAVLSGITFLMNSKNKKTFLTTASTLIAAFIPRILAEIVAIISHITYSAYKITSPINGLLSLISTVFVFFAIKELNDEQDDDSAIKKFLIVEGIFYITRFVLSFLSISI